MINGPTQQAVWAEDEWAKCFRSDCGFLMSRKKFQWPLPRSFCYPKNQLIIFPAFFFKGRPRMNILICVNVAHQDMGGKPTRPFWGWRKHFPSTPIHKTRCLQKSDPCPCHGKCLWKLGETNLSTKFPQSLGHIHGNLSATSDDDFHENNGPVLVLSCSTWLSLTRHRLEAQDQQGNKDNVGSVTEQWQVLKFEFRCYWCHFMSLLPKVLEGGGT